jgi:hypothetical protein
MLRIEGRMNYASEPAAGRLPAGPIDKLEAWFGGSQF